jgi:Spy/CpxP family protein refolding chaperone
MKNFLFILTIVLVAMAASPAQAQKRPNQDRANQGKADGAQIEAIKVGLITKRLELSPDQSKQFWPVYDAYTKDIQLVRRELRQLKRRGLTLTDDELKKEMEKMFDLMEKEVDTQRKYHREFLRVVSPRQVAELYKAEAEFKALLLKRLGARMGEDEGE